MSDLVASEPEPTSAPAAPVPTDATDATTQASWLEILGRIGSEEGAFTPVGDHHWALLVEDGPTLLVSFETIDSARGRPGQMPLAHDLAAARGWSHLCLIADGPTWFRDPAVYAYFDGLVDDDFYDRFDQVLFYGAGMAGYAACAFAVTAPGAHVLALNPRATLAPAQAGWDGRNRAARRLDFTSRYGYAPDMLEGAGRVVVIHDPTLPEEAMHAALFRAPYITRLSARHIGERLEPALINMSLLPGLIEAAMRGDLDTARFAALWRTRRSYGPFLRILLNKAANARRPGHELMICRSVTARLRAPGFVRRLAALTAEAGAGQ